MNESEGIEFPGEESYPGSLMNYKASPLEIRYYLDFRWVRPPPKMPWGGAILPTFNMAHEETERSAVDDQEARESLKSVDEQGFSNRINEILAIDRSQFKNWEEKWDKSEYDEIKNQCEITWMMARIGGIKKIQERIQGATCIF